MRDFGISACPKSFSIDAVQEKFARLGEMIQNEHKNCLKDWSRLKVSLLSDREIYSFLHLFGKMGGGKRVNRYFESTIISRGELKKWALLPISS